MNFAEEVKKQTDRILRQQRLNGTARVTVSGGTSGGDPPTVDNPSRDLARHKNSADHDGRYYTKAQLNNGQLDDRYYTQAEVDAFIAEASRRWEPLTDNNLSDPEILFDTQGDLILVEVI